MKAGQRTQDPLVSDQHPQELAWPVRSPFSTATPGGGGNPRQPGSNGRVESCRRSGKDHFPLRHPGGRRTPWLPSGGVNRQLGTSNRSTRKEISKFGWTPARGCAIQHPRAPPYRHTAMPSPATAAREPPPTACWCTWTPSRPTISLSIQGWRMYPSPAGATDAQIYTNDAERLGAELSL